MTKTQQGGEGGRRIHLPKFKLSAKFPIGLHVDFKTTDKKIKTWLNQVHKILLTENQPCTSEINLKFVLKLHGNTCAINGRTSVGIAIGCCQIKLGYSDLSTPPPFDPETHWQRRKFEHWGWQRPREKLNESFPQGELKFREKTELEIRIIVSYLIFSESIISYFFFFCVCVCVLGCVCVHIFLLFKYNQKSQQNHYNHKKLQKITKAAKLQYHTWLYKAVENLKKNNLQNKGPYLFKWRDNLPFLLAMLYSISLCNLNERFLDINIRFLSWYLHL